MQYLANMMMQETTPEEAVRQYRAREAAERVERAARMELSKKVGIRLQDAVVGQVYRIQALYSGDVVLGKYVGCQGSHENIAYGVHVGAIGYFVDTQQGYRTALTTSQLEPGGGRAQWFMVPDPRSF